MDHPHICELRKLATSRDTDPGLRAQLVTMLDAYERRGRWVNEARRERDTARAEADRLREQLRCVRLENERLHEGLRIAGAARTATPLTEEQRDDLSDLIMPKGTPIWSDEEELAAGHFGHTTLAWWADTLGHPSAHPGCCKTCGCATTCLFGAFYNSLVDTVLRELYRVGALVIPAAPDVAAGDATTERAEVRNAES